MSDQQPENAMYLRTSSWGDYPKCEHPLVMEGGVAGYCQRQPGHDEDGEGGHQATIVVTWGRPEAVEVTRRFEDDAGASPAFTIDTAADRSQP